MHKNYLAISLLCILSIISLHPLKAQVSFSPSTLPAGFPAAGLNPISRWLTADFDNDGDADILYQSGSTSGQGIHFLQNDGSGVFTDIAASAAGVFSSGPFNGVTFTLICVGGLTNGIQYLADYDNDGDLDMFEITGTTTHRYIKNNNGSWAVTADPTGIPTSITVTRWVTGDFDKDGDVDILYQNGAGSGLGIGYLENNGSGSFTNTAANGTGTFTGTPFNGITFTFISPTSNVAQHPADYDNDGDVDIFEITSTTTRYLKNNNGVFSVVTAPTNFPSGPFTVLNRWVPADYDGDGDIDVIYQTGNTTNQNIVYLQNNGSGGFTSTAASAAGTFTGTPFNGQTFSWIGQANNNGNLAIADYDNDGDLDIFELTTTTSRLLANSGAAPLISSSTPAKGATNLSRNANIALTFNQAVTAGAGNIYIRNSDGTAFETIPANDARVTGSGTANITINPSGTLAASSDYYLTFDINTFTIPNGKQFGMVSSYKRQLVAATSSTLLNFSTGTALPVTFTAFTAQQQQDHILLSWQTAIEQNSKDFVIQHSVNGNDWQPIGTVAAAGNSSTIQKYVFQDPQPATGVNLYRLKQSDLDGKYTYSTVASAAFRLPQAILTIRGNPVFDGTLKLMAPKNMPISISTSGGAQLLQRQLTTGMNMIDVSNFAKGNYFIRSGQTTLQFIIR
jgi:methionine-rich copper-binding protein CopC